VPPRRLGLWAGLSGNPFALVGDMPAWAVDQERIAAVNRRDKVGPAA